MSLANAILPSFVLLWTAAIIATYLLGSGDNVVTKVGHWRAKTPLEWIAAILYGGVVTFVIGQLTAKVEELTLAKGEAFWCPDIQPPYSPSELYDVLRGYGSDGRRWYVFTELWDIFIYGYNYALFWSSALQWASGKRGITSLSMLPWIVWCLDQLENSAQTYCVLNFDEEGPSSLWKAAAVVGNAANCSKWAGFGIFVASTLWLAARRLLGFTEVEIKENTKKD